MFGKKFVDSGFVKKMWWTGYKAHFWVPLNFLPFSPGNVMQILQFYPHTFTKLSIFINETQLENWKYVRDKRISAYVQLNEYETDPYFLLMSHHLTSYCFRISEDLHRFAQIWSQNCFCYCLAPKIVQKQ